MKRDKIISGLQITCDELAFNVIKEKEKFDELKHTFDIEEKLIQIYFFTDTPVETYKSVVYNGYINPFNDNFINYLHGRLHELKRKLKWAELIDLSYMFDVIEINYNISNNFDNSFFDYLKNLSLSKIYSAFDHFEKIEIEGKKRYIEK